MIAQATHTSPVTVSLPALQSSTPIADETLLEAFGPSSLGILIVSDLPPHFLALRARVLSKISKLAHLPTNKLDALTNEQAKYLVGWSHGKETLREGVTDWLKGSYYVNTAFDESDSTITKMRQDYEGFNEYLAPNIWPAEDDLADFRKDVEELVILIVDVARYVARAIDRFGERNIENWPAAAAAATNDQEGYLEGVVRNSRTSKARLLHYFPSSDTENKTGPETGSSQKDETDDSWCSVHKDHSCLTGLTSAAFFDESSADQKYNELEASPSPTAGLYILDRENNVHKVSIPRDSLAFQTGEALERITKGKLKAVPHFVRGVDGDDGGLSRGRKIARNTLAVFTQPNLFEVVDLDRRVTFAEFAKGIVDKNTAG